MSREDLELLETLASGWGEKGSWLNWLWFNELYYEHKENKQ